MTLVLNDILSNLRHPRRLGVHLMARSLSFGVRRPRISRPIRRLFVSDLAEVCDQSFAWAAIPNLRRIIVPHGDVIDAKPDQALSQAAADFVGCGRRPKIPSLATCPTGTTNSEP